MTTSPMTESARSLDGPLVSNGHVLDGSPARLGTLAETPPYERQDRQALLDRLSRQGYLLLREALDPGVVRSFRKFYFSKLRHTGLISEDADVADGVDSGAAIDLQEFRRSLVDIIVPSEEYADVCNHSSIRGLMAWLLDGDIHLHKRRILRHRRPDEFDCSTPAHYDLVYLRGGTTDILSLWIPLGDCPVERGGLMYLEGSDQVYRDRDERTGRKLNGAAVTADLPALADGLDTRWLVTDYEAGDLVIHSPYVVHASNDNVDPERVLRLSTDIRYQLASQPIDPRWQNHWRPDDGL